ncbi:hypothetical protein [Tenacibaculum aiptasiae]|uniref:hypothetical protein n=1 Tax=Tenacibaculum aiptasiae TaxID=426481 RepID=UPI00232C875F|nr:hypothetical protein [Tenacibaculum aiptasiae]
MQDKLLQEIEAYLKIKDTNSIDIFDYDNPDLKYHRKLTYAGLKSQAESLQALIADLHYSYKTNCLGIFKFKGNGTSHKKDPYIIKINNISGSIVPDKVVQETAGNVADSQPATPPVLNFHNQGQYNQPMNLPGMGAANPMNQHMGMGMAQTLDLYRKADRYEDLLKDHDELKQTLKKKESHIESLVVDNRKLKSDLHLASQVKHLALEAEKLNKKPFIAPDTINKLFELVPNFIPGATNNTAGMAAPDLNQGISENKKALIGLVKSSAVDDLLAEELSHIAVGTKIIPAFKEELMQLIKKHNIKEKI